MVDNAGYDLSGRNASPDCENDRDEMQIHEMHTDSAGEASPAGVRARIAALCATLLPLLGGCDAGQGARATEPIEVASSGLVFIRAVDGASEVMRVRLSDGEEVAITATPDHNERWPYWSTAANRLVYQREPVTGGNSDLFLWDPQTAAPVALRESADRDERWPAWSPDGERLAYAFRGGTPPAGIASEKIGGVTWVLAASGAREFFFRPSFAADGSRLVAQRRGAGGTGSNLWLLAPEEVPRPLIDDPNFFDMKPWFTRGGTHVVFSRRQTSSELSDIAIVALDTGEIRLIASSPDTDDHSGRPAPHRDEITFSSNRRGSYDVFLTDFEGESVRALTDWPDRDELAPRWSPDGERLVFTTQPVGAPASGISMSHVVAIDRDGRVLLDIPGAMADWMPGW